MTVKQPPDEEIDFSDAPEITDFTRKERGKFHPRRLALEAEVRRLREALQQIADLADAEEPLSVRAGQVAREALEATGSGK